MTIFLATQTLSALAQAPAGIGLFTLRSIDPTLTGLGVRVTQTEAGFPTFEVNSNIQPAAVFTYYGSNGIASTFPNSLGSESDHADQVGLLMFGNQGVASGVAAVDNYDANFFENVVLSQNQAVAGLTVNQSYIDDVPTVQDEIAADQAYDDWIATQGIVCVSAVGNSGIISPPASGYNCTAVGAWGGLTGYGPTADNGRAKPDLVAPAGATSFSTPLVTGAAAILRQAGLRGDAGTANESLSTDQKTIKALLLNGAIKPANWTNAPTVPLDYRYGAGILNVYNSWRQLAGGRLSSPQHTLVRSGSPHPPSATLTFSSGLSGWDNGTVTSSGTFDNINHYGFHVASGTAQSFAAVITLVWMRPAGATSIRNLDLFLYRVSDGALVGSSTSPRDNVEHIFLPNLEAGDYDLEVMNQASTSGPGGLAESYAVAVSFSTGQLGVHSGANGITLTWPIYPDGLILQGIGVLGAGASWTNCTEQVTLTNGQNAVTINGSGAGGFFRLRSP